MSLFRFVPRAVVALASFALLLPARALNPSLPPSGNFDLSHWKLTLPTGPSGNPDEILPAQMSSGYTNPPYFLTASDGAMRFWAPVTGTTTSGSSFPRCELREQLTAGADAPNWFGAGTHILNGQVVVRQTPSTGKVIIGQIHGKTDPNGADANPLVKLSYNSTDNSVHVQIKDSPFTSNTNEQSTTVGAGALTIGTTITYQIKVVDGVATVTINNYTPVSRDFFASDAAWQNTDLYFKAGSYCQDNVGNSSEGAMVDFYALTIQHGTTPPPPNITTTTLPSGRTTINYGSQQLAATGGTPPYTWSLSAGALPAGLSLAPSTGIISGTPTTAGTANFTAKVTDAASQIDTQALSITINTNSIPDITTTSLPGATTGTAYSQSVASTGGDGALTWSVLSGSLPAGLSLGNVNSQSATISGTPTTTGTASFTLKLADVDADNDTQALSIVVSAPAQVVAPTLTPGTGTYTSAQSVTMSTTTTGATIRYTSDGSTPSQTNGTVYSSAVAVSTTTTLKAIAYKTGMTDSTVTSATYTISIAGDPEIVPVAAPDSTPWDTAGSNGPAQIYDGATADGGNGSRWASNASPGTLASAPRYVTLDLGAAKNITKFVVWPYQARAYSYKIYVSTDGVNFGSPVVNVQQSTGATSYTHTLGSAAVGRYVKLLVDGVTGVSTTWASINEFDIFGTAASNTPPTISDITNQTIAMNGNTGALAFTVGDAETAAASLGVSGSSSNPTLVPNANITFGGSGASRTVTVTPASGQTGTATITVTVTDGGGLTASDTFTLTVNSGSNNVPVVLEAESVSFDSNWVNISDANAFSGHALQAQTNSTSSAPANGGLVYSFTLGTSSTIYIQTRSRSPNGGSSDSFWVRLDGGSWAQFVQGGTNSYTWSNKSFSSVASGAHTFEIRYREAQAVLDEVAVTLNSTPPN